MHKTLINKNWYFKKGESIPEALVLSEYEAIDLPHTYNAIDGQDGGDDYYRGYGIYAKEFTFEYDQNNPKTFIEFEGVGQSCDVYLNGEYLGRHEGGYSTFRFEISDYLKDKNILIVRTDNTKNDKVYPQMADFTFYGGIYRNVSLISCKENHFNLADYGSSGIYITPQLKDGIANIKICALVSGKGEVEFKIEDDKTVVEVENGVARANLSINNPHLWDGLNDPFLYTLEASLVIDDEVVDERQERFGIREFEVDPNEGFFLNGKSYPLRGVSKHQDRLNIGNAVSEENLIEDMDLIKELGATTIRLAHYQHAQEFYNLADEVGMVIWAEIPYISQHMPNGKDNTISQMKELIKQNYNHPSIVCWGLSNEITIGGNAEDPSLLDNHCVLNDLVHELDKTRPTTMAHVMTLDTKATLVELPDIASYNHYYGWYVGDTSGYAKFFDKFHEEHPNFCIGLSEYGADANPKLHSINPKKGDYTEEYQAKYHEEVLDFINERPYLWATHVWNMFDFAADARREGDNPGKNQKGLVTMDRKTKKDSFYLYKSYWNKDDKFVHICSKRYVNRHEDETLVKIYSNLNEVELYLDGKFFDKQSGNNIFRFIVPISGKHHLEAKSGEYVDSIDIIHVNEKDESYILEETGAMNWFDDYEDDPNYYSISDTYGELMRNKETASIIEELMSKARAERGEIAQEAAKNEGLQEIMNDMQFSSMLTLAGGGVSAEDIKKLNAALQKVKK